MEPAPVDEVNISAWPLQDTLDTWLSEQNYPEIFRAIAAPWFGSLDAHINPWLNNQAIEKCDVPLMYECISRMAPSIREQDLETQKEHLVMIMVSLALAKADFDCCKGLAHVDEAATQIYDIFSKHYAYLVASSFCKRVSYADAFKTAKVFMESIDLDKLPLPVWAAYVVDATSLRSYNVAFGCPKKYVKEAYKSSLIMSQVRNVRASSLQTTWDCFSAIESWQDFFKLSAADLVKAFGPENKTEANLEENLTKSIRTLTLNDNTTDQTEQEASRQDAPSLDNAVQEHEMVYVQLDPDAAELQPQEGSVVKDQATTETENEAAPVFVPRDDQNPVNPQ
jgi:hypothetical protein